MTTPSIPAGEFGLTGPAPTVTITAPDGAVLFGTDDGPPADGSYLHATYALVQCPGNRLRRKSWPHGQYVEFGEDRLARIHGHGTVGGDPVLWNTAYADTEATDYELLVNNPRPEPTPEEAAERAAEQAAS